MQAFIARENLKLYERKLDETVDPEKRERLSRLIDTERARLRRLTGSNPRDLA